MATVATRREKKSSLRQKKLTMNPESPLTPTGLLMESLNTQISTSFD